MAPDPDFTGHDGVGLTSRAVTVELPLPEPDLSGLTGFEGFRGAGGAFGGATTTGGGGTAALATVSPT